MRKNAYLGNILLAAVTAIAMLVLVLFRTFAPFVVCPVLNIPNLLVLCVIALVLEYYLAPAGASSCRICGMLLAAVTFGALPMAAGVITVDTLWLVALLGGVVYGAAKWLFDSIAERLNSGPAGKAAALFTGVGMILAGQAFAGMIL